MIRVTSRVGRDTYVTTGPILWFFGWAFAISLAVLLLPVLLITAGLYVAWRRWVGPWFTSRFPRTTNALLTIAGLWGIALVVIAVDAILIAMFPGAGGWVVAVVVDIAGIVALLVWLASLMPAPAGTPAPPLSESEKIRQTRGWS